MPNILDRSTPYTLNIIHKTLKRPLKARLAKTSQIQAYKPPKRIMGQRRPLRRLLSQDYSTDHAMLTARAATAARGCAQHGGVATRASCAVTNAARLPGSAGHGT